MALSETVARLLSGTSAETVEQPWHYLLRLQLLTQPRGSERGTSYLDRITDLIIQTSALQDRITHNMANIHSIQSLNHSLLATQSTVENAFTLQSLLARMEASLAELRQSTPDFGSSERQQQITSLLEQFVTGDLRTPVDPARLEVVSRSSDAMRTLRM